jgi:predicted ATPase/DNA-binding XRE family transcriptional regulator
MTLPPQDRERPVFGNLLRRLRLNARLSQEALAERARISVQAVSALERGARHAPQRQTLTLLAAALDLEDGDLVGFETAAADSATPRVRTTGRASRNATSRSLPAIPTSFLGRDREVAEIAVLLETKRAVTLWGAGGVGKTRLAIEAANAGRPTFPDGIFFVDLATVVDASGVAGAVAAVLGVAERPNCDVAEAIIAMLGDARALIVFDNCEHVIESSSRLAERLIAPARHTVLLCTSREPLRITGEQVYEVEPLPSPRADDGLAALRTLAAVRLFADRAAGAGIACGAAEDDVRKIAAICRRLDGIPLAIELAAARLANMDLGQIAAALDERFALLTRGSRTAPSRQRTLAGALDWSYDLLRAEEQVVLRRLAVLIGNWTLDDAWAVAGDSGTATWATSDIVADLVDKAMVSLSSSAAGDRRYRMLETMREYALIKLRDAGELEERERRHAQHVRANAELALAAFRSGADDPFERLDADNVRAALHWAITWGNDPPFGAALAGAVSPFWDALGQHVEGLRWIDSSIAFLAADDVSPPAVEAWLGMSRLSSRLVLHREALASAERAVLLADRNGDPSLRGMARVLSAYAASSLGEHDRSASRIDEAAAIFGASAVPGGMTRVLHARAFAAFQNGRPDEARDALERVVALQVTEGSGRTQTHATIDLAEAEYRLGNRVAAIARAHDALAGARAHDVPHQITAALENLAAYLLDAGEIEAAAAAANEACALAFEQRYGILTAIAIQHCAFAGALRGRTQEPARLTGYVDSAFRDASVPRGYTEQRAYDGLVGKLRAQMTETELSVALDSGALLSEAEAVRVALRIGSSGES